MIIVNSHPLDAHATRVLDRLAARGQPATLLDVADFPDRATLTLDFAEPAKPVGWVDHETRGRVRVTDATAVWWRRPQLPMLDAVTDDAARGFVHGEWHEATHGLYRLLDCPWMNPPDSNDAASRKALQLQVASRLGLRVPDTMMTSDRGEAVGFVERLGLDHVVYKIFSATYQVWRETRRLGADDLPMLDSLRLAPVIFQELIPAVADLRVTIVGDQVFAMAIDTRGTSYDVDFRISLAQARTSAATLPPDVEVSLRALMGELGLVYGAVDLRLTSEGEYVFLEVNPAGEFLFSEHGSGQPITDAVAGWLAAPGAS
jgi:glutathione synthase/RimK-type ligase-like ATP-grasp enzyme